VPAWTHVAILDIGLPDVDGYGVAERLRERLGEESPVFAALTGYSQDRDRTRSQAVGFRHHFVPRDWFWDPGSGRVCPCPSRPSSSPWLPYWCLPV
jgi:CheY-like chemotaxis protein